MNTKKQILLELSTCENLIFGDFAAGTSLKRGLSTESFLKSGFLFPFNHLTVVELDTVKCCYPAE